MKLIYLTSKKFPSSKADPFYVRSMAKAFAELLDQDFLFLIRGEIPDELNGINTLSLNFPRRFRIAFYFFRLPILIKQRGWNSKETFFLSYDPYLLAILIFWRKIFRFKYLIGSDWHQLFDDWKDKYVSENSDYLTCTSRRLKGLLMSVCGVAESKILVAYGGVNPQPFLQKQKIPKSDLRRELTLPEDSYLVGYIGGFRSLGLEKGLSTMIKALPHVKENIKMVFVGGSQTHIDEYKILAQEMNVQDRCIFREKQKPFEKVVEYQLAMDILVIPYPDKHHFRDYGFPMKVWEYMSAGRPIVYSNLPIMGEILEGRATAFLPDSPTSLAKAILSVYGNVLGAEEIARQNPQTVLAYTWKARALNILNFINK